MTVAVVENDALPKGYFTYRYRVLLRNSTCQFLKSPNRRNSQEHTEVGMGEEIEDEDVIKISLSHCQFWPSKPIKSLFFCLSLSHLASMYFTLYFFDFIFAPETAWYIRKSTDFGDRLTQIYNLVPLWL